MSKNEISYADAFVSSFGGLVINWGAKGKGFGQMYMNVDKESGKIKIDTEFCGKEFTKDVFIKIVEDAILTDFTDIKKNVEVVNLEQANKSFDWNPHILQIPFWSEECKHNPNLVQHRWNLKDGKVLNVWFQKDLNHENVLEFASNITTKKSFEDGFVKAEIWGWEYTEKVRG